MRADWLVPRTDTIIRRLDCSWRSEVLRHLHALPLSDRWLRFPSAVDDASIERYVSAIDFMHDRVFGMFDDNSALRGVAHLAPPRHGDTAVLGLSVARDSRGRGYGTALLEAARREADQLGLCKLHMAFLAENRVMVHLARKVGMTLDNPVQPRAYLLLGAGGAPATVRTLRATNSC